MRELSEKEIEAVVGGVASDYPVLGAIGRMMNWFRSSEGSTSAPKNLGDFPTGGSSTV